VTPSPATDLFDYALPPRLVAQEPAARRDGSRLLVVDRASRRLSHQVFADLPAFLRAGDTLFRNDAAVLPARLHAVRPTGGRVECLLLNPLHPGGDRGPSHPLSTGDQGGDGRPARPFSTGDSADGEIWRCLLKPGRKLPVGATFAASDGAFSARIIAWDEGTAEVAFTTRGGEAMTSLARRLGDVPLPPYIGRPDRTRRAQDLERYQTVYADRMRPVAVAAPTAGLHFTPEMLADLADRGVRTADLTLHVGLGTFRPIATETVSGHAIHREVYEIPVSTQSALYPPASGPNRGRRVAVGTTAVRAIEDFLGAHEKPTGRPYLGEAAIYIYPPAAFRGVDALITNFHQPRSTLLCLVAAFLTPGSTDGIPWIKDIYAEAISREYRFFSYGDAMLII
jgi:S-adenosylmethionine:tRNA ribosyltransferase-isomerase